MKNILVVIGGGRANGNTMQLADSFIAGAKEAGHQVEKISLLKEEVKGCLGCNACRFGKPCIQKDDFHEMIPKIKAADLIVFASPLYFWTISSRLKAFIERLEESRKRQSRVREKQKWRQREQGQNRDRKNRFSGF